MIKKNHFIFDYVLLIGMSITLLGGLLIVNFNSFPQWIALLFRVSAFLIGLLIFLKNNRLVIKKHLLLLVFISLIYIYFTLIALNFLFVLIIITFLNDERFENVINSFFFTLLISVSIVVIFTNTGIIKNDFDINSNIAADLLGNNSDRIRYKFGFDNPNSFATIVSSLIFVMTHLSRKMLPLAGLISYYVFSLSDSKSVMASFLLILLFNFIIFIFDKQFKVMKLITISFILFPIIIILLLLFNPSIVPKEFDLLLSGRITNITAYFNFFTPVNYILGGVSMSNDFAVDNTFALIIGTYGLFIFSLFIYFFTISILFFLKNNLHKEYIFTMSYYFYSFSESNLFRPETLACLIFWILIFSPYFKSNLFTNKIICKFN
jgi:hypothetical protein